MFTRPLTTFAALALAIVSCAPAAQARHHGHRHHHRIHAAKVRLIPAHQRPDWVGIAAVPVPGLVDVGYGPIFPLGGWPSKL